jgi:pyruvate/2-oxoglutarate dehydrogenase complex dihydrolipoamide acyltransferase (E2) component
MSVDITLASLAGEYMQSAVLVEWRVTDGGHVAAGDVVAVVETAKAATEIAAPADGTLHILVPTGDEVAVGTVLAQVGAPSPTATAPEPETGAPVPPPRPQRLSPTPAAAAAGPGGLPRRWPAAYASPLAKRLAAARGTDLTRVRGSGPGGRIVRADLSDVTRPPGNATFKLTMDVNARALREARAAQWDAGERRSIGEIVASKARSALNRAGLGWPVVVDDELSCINALVVIDLASFGVADFTAPDLPCRAVLGLAAPSADTLRLSLAADAYTLRCTDAARFLTLLRAALETPANA